MAEIAVDQCAVKLLPDEPSSEDSFGSHDRVANALYELICGAEGGKAIGLRGSWGSGKSTVANLLGARLSKQGAPVDTAYLTFDAWAHRGDPLRRSFLQRIVPFLLEKGWVDKDPWEKRLARLAFTEEHAEQLAQPHVTPLGAALGAALALTPLGAALLGAYAGDDKVHSSFVGMPVWGWGLVLALLPMLVVMVGVLSKSRDDELSAIFFQRPPEKILTRTQRSPDPTSIEFGRIFSELMRSALAGHERQVVIVVDNLDRVDAGEALTIWSTMRTFFETGSSSELSWRRKVWLIVPFDPRSIGRLWQQEPLQEEVANAFLEKTFQVQFDVPEPVSSDWKAFLAEHLGSALPEHDTDDFRTVYRLFRHVGVSQQPLTPRRIKLFVNRLGALHRLWGDSIPLPLQALYVLIHDQLRDPSKSVTTIDLDDRTLTIVDSSDWRNRLAALHHNVPTEKALQVLITPQVEEALAIADLDWLREQERIPGFDDIVERIVEDSHKDWSMSEPLTLANTALSIAGLEGEAKGAYSQTWRYLSLAAMAVERWPGLSERLADGLLLVLSHCPPATKDQLTVRVLAALGASFKPGDNDGAS